MDNEEINELNYFLSQNDKFLVISLIGSIETASYLKIQSLLTEILMRDEGTLTIINFQETTSISGDAVIYLAQLQKQIRSKKMFLRICCLKPSMQQKLDLSGVIRNSEIMVDLPTALQSLIEIRKK